MKSKIILALTITLLISGCNNPPAPTDGVTICHNPRPHICPMIYAPVCDPLHHKTYSNGCVACSHSEVLYYKRGKCK